MSITATGMNEYLSLGFETSFKTMPGTPNASKVPVTNPSIKANRNKFQSNALTGSPQPNQVVWGKGSVDGSFGIECNKDSLMPIFRGLFSAPTTTGTTGFQEHVYTLGAQESMFIELGLTDIDQYFLWNGLYLNSGSFNFQAEGLMEASANVMGAKQTFSGTSAVTGTLTDLTTAYTFSYLNIRLKQNGSQVAWGKTLNLEVNRNGYSEFAMDETNEVAFIGFAKAAVTGTVTARFTDEASLLAAITAAQNGTETSLEVFIPAGSGHGFVFVLPTIVFDPASVTTQGTGVVEVSFAFTAHARGSASAVAGGVRSKYFSTVAGLSGKTLEIKVDGAAAQTVTFGAGDDTYAEVAAAINTQTTGCTASVEKMAEESGAVIRIVSDTTGTGSSIQIVATSTADTDLGFDNAIHSGLANQSIVVYLMNAQAA